MPRVSLPLKEEEIFILDSQVYMFAVYSLVSIGNYCTLLSLSENSLKSYSCEHSALYKIM